MDSAEVGEKSKLALVTEWVMQKLLDEDDTINLVTMWNQYCRDTHNESVFIYSNSPSNLDEQFSRWSPTYLLRKVADGGFNTRKHKWFLIKDSGIEGFNHLSTVIKVDALASFLVETCKNSDYVSFYV